MFSKLSSVVLAVFLAYGWVWTNYLVELHLMTERQRMYMLVLITLVFLGHQIYLVMPRAVARGAVEARKPVADAFLKNCLSQYDDELAKEGGTSPSVRLNVMLPTRKFKLFEVLYIYYYACPQGVVYTEMERDCPWWKKDGTCGWAWAKRQTTIFDSKDPDLRAAARRLKKYQLDAVAHIQSVLSVPIWDADKVVGVLNIDSESNVGQTRFNQENIWQLAEASARCLAALCFREGVKRS